MRIITKILTLIVLSIAIVKCVNAQTNSSVKGVQSLNSDSATVRFLAKSSTSFYGDSTTVGWQYYNPVSKKWRVYTNGTWKDLLTPAGSTTTASNGLNKVVNDIRLGGALTSNTSISGAFDLNFNNTGKNLWVGNIYSGTSTSYPGEFGPNILLQRAYTNQASLDEHGLIDLNTFARAGQAYAHDDDQSTMVTGNTYNHHASFQARPKIQAGATVTNIYGHTFLPINISGSFGTLYGFMHTQSTGNDYGFYHKGTVAHTQRGGPFGVYVESTPSFFGAEVRTNRVTATTNGPVAVNYQFTESTGTPADGLGPITNAGIRVAGVDNTLGFVGFARDGANNSGSFDVWTATAGSATRKFRIRPSGNLEALSLAGTGTRMVTADVNGVLATQAIPGGGGSPGGATTNIQYNNAGSFAGNADFSVTGLGTTSQQVSLGNNATNTVSFLDVKGDISGVDQLVRLSSQAGSLIYQSGPINFQVGGGGVIKATSSDIQMSTQTAGNNITIIGNGTDGNVSLIAGDAGSVSMSNGTSLTSITIGPSAGGDVTISGLNPVTGRYLIITSLPTSAAGLPSGAIWSNLGILTIVP